MAYDLGTNCGLKHPFNKGKRTHCNKVKACISQTCNPLISINPNLFESCKGYCQNQPTVQHEDYLCNVIGADVLFNNYGLLRCGYTPEESAQGQIYEQVTETKNWGNIIAITALVLIILSGLYYLIFKN